MEDSAIVDMDGVITKITAPNSRCPRSDSNAQPSDPKSDALSIELRGQFSATRADKIILDLTTPENGMSHRAYLLAIVSSLGSRPCLLHNQATHWSACACRGWLPGTPAGKPV